MARRDAPGLGIARQSSRCVGRGGEVEPKRAGARPAFGVARDAVPSRNRWGFAFRRQADGGAHRGRPCARAAELAMLGSITDLLGAETVASSAFESDGSWTEIADLRGRRTPLRHVEEGHVDHVHKIAECLESWERSPTCSKTQNGKSPDAGIHNSEPCTRFTHRVGSGGDLVCFFFVPEPLSTGSESPVNDFTGQSSNRALGRRAGLV